MNAQQLLKQLRTNRDLLTRNNEQAYEDFQMLKKEYAHVVNDEVTLSFELNHSMAEVHFKSNYSGAIENSLAVVDKFNNSEHKELLALHLKTIGYCFAYLGEFNLAENNLLEALAIVTPSDPDYASIRSEVLHTLAMNEDIREEGNGKAIQYLTEAIDLLVEKKHAAMRANCMMGLGNLYNNVENLEEALKNYRAAADTFEQQYMLRNMAAAYSNIGNCHIKLKDFDIAEEYQLRSLELRMKSGSPDDISNSYFNLACVYRGKNDLYKTEEYLEKSKVILEQIGNVPFLKLVNEMMDDLERTKKEVTSQ
jgi:tetratricopeptide (TPR) repeat protein